MADERPYFEELVEKVQTLQRTNPDGKLKWMSYALLYGSGRYDPKYHTREYMIDFFEQLEADLIEIDPSVRGAPGPVVRNEVFVGHLPQDVEESEIYGYFGEWGQVTKVEFKEGRGFCFVTFATEAEVDTLLEHHDEHHIRDQHVDVKRAEDRRKGGKGKSDAGKGSGKGSGKGGNKGKGGKGGKGESSGKGYSGGKRSREDNYDEPPAKKGKGGKSNGGGFSKGGSSKGGSKGGYGGKSQKGGGDSSAGWGPPPSSQPLKRISPADGDEWWSTPPSAPRNNDKGGKGGGKGGKGGSKGASGGKGGGYQKGGSSKGGYEQKSFGGGGGHGDKGKGGGKSGGHGHGKGKGKGKGRAAPY